MKKLEQDLLVKMLEAFRIYSKECWVEFVANGGKPITHNTFYEFMKEKLSGDLTKMTGADIRERNNQQLLA